MMRWFVGVVSVWLVAAAVVLAGEIQVLEFTAPWCSACKSMAPAVAEATQQGVPIRKIDVDQDKHSAARYGVAMLPTFILVDDGREVSRITGGCQCEDLLRLAGRVQPRSDAASRPKPAWRYEQHAGKYRAVVRVRTADKDSMASVGSGVIVRWAGRVIVLTAQHVVRDARTVWVRLFGGRWLRARIKCWDETWDCAVLELDGDVGEIFPADIMFVEHGPLVPGFVLETCGFGGADEDRLAVNTGRLQRFGEPQASRLPSDWMLISGRSRGGDSGGPIFDMEGRVAGILWGSDGEGITGVQPGRLHKILRYVYPDTATTTAQQRAPLAGRLVPVDWPAHAAPTPMMSQPVVAQPATAAQPSVQPPVSATGCQVGANCQGLLPWNRQPPMPQQPSAPPQVIVHSDPALSAKLDQLIANTTPRAEAVAPAEEARGDDDTKPALVAVLIAAGILLAGIWFYVVKQN